MGFSDEVSHANHHTIPLSNENVQIILEAIFQHCFTYQSKFLQEFKAHLLKDIKALGSMIIEHHHQPHPTESDDYTPIHLSHYLLRYLVSSDSIPTLIQQSYMIIDHMHQSQEIVISDHFSSDSVREIFQNTSDLKILSALQTIHTLKRSPAIVTGITPNTIDLIHSTFTGNDLTDTFDASESSVIEDHPGHALLLNMKVGEEIGAQNWILEEKIGMGGMGSVWKVKNYFGDVGALKLMSPKLSRSERFIERFQSEIKALKKLKHPNIVSLLDWGCDKTHDNDLWYFVTEFIEGQSLSEYIYEQGFITEPKIYEIFLELSYGLKAAHEQSIIHRDIKPSNIMLQADGKPILIDFGIAKSKKDPRITRSSGQLLTLKFASPEQIYGDTVKPASDIFSLAATINECFIKTHDQSRPKFYPDSTPQRYHDVLSKCLKYEVDDRPQNMDEFIALWKQTYDGMHDASVSSSHSNVAQSSSEQSIHSDPLNPIPEAKDVAIHSENDVQDAEKGIPQHVFHNAPQGISQKSPQATQADLPSTQAQKLQQDPVDSSPQDTQNQYRDQQTTQQTTQNTHTLDIKVERWFEQAKSTLYTQLIAIFSFILSIVTTALYIQLSPLFVRTDFQSLHFKQIPNLLLFYAASCFFLTLPLYKVKMWSLILIIACTISLLPLYYEFYVHTSAQVNSTLTIGFIYILLTYTVLLALAFWPFFVVTKARKKLRQRGFNLNY